MAERIRITTYGGELTRNSMGGLGPYRSVQHWQLHFDDLFLMDTSAPHHVAKWRELAALVNKEEPDEQAT